MRRLAKMTWLELKLFAREPLTVIFTMAIPLILLFILGGVFGNTPDPDEIVYRGAGFDLAPPLVAPRPAPRDAGVVGCLPA